MILYAPDLVLRLFLMTVAQHSATRRRVGGAVETTFWQCCQQILNRWMQCRCHRHARMQFSRKLGKMLVHEIRGWCLLETTSTMKCLNSPAKWASFLKFMARNCANHARLAWRKFARSTLRSLQVHVHAMSVENIYIYKLVLHHRFPRVFSIIIQVVSCYLSSICLIYLTSSRKVFLNNML